MKLISTLYFFITSMVILTACATNEKTTNSSEFTEQDRQDILYMMKLSEKGRPVAINLADSIQYRFVKRTFEASGKTPDIYPQQFKALEEARKLHLGSGVPDEKELAMNSGLSGLKVPMNVLTELGMESQQNYASAALSSVPGGTYITQINLRLFDANGNPLGPLATNTEYGEGENTTVRANGSSNSRNVGADSIKALFSYYYQGLNGTPYMGSYTVTTMASATNIQNIDPMPVRHTANKITKICLGRGSSSTSPNACVPSNPQSTDCDYCFNQASYANVFFPVSGNITYSDVIDPITFQGDSATNAFCFIDVIQFMQGGGCPILISQNNFFKDPNTKVQGNALSWNLNPANFGKACYVSYGDSLTYNFIVRVNIKGQPVFVSITNAAGTDTTNQNTKLIPKIFAVWGCMAEGTLIKMADGSIKAIEQILVKDRIVADSKGTILTVENTLKGNEEIPMYRIKTDKNNSVLLTEEHPVITERGVMLSKQLLKGDILFTQDGKTAITSITREKFNGAIWNLDVGLTEDNVSLSDSSSTFFANGIMVGDGKMQRLYSIRNRTKKAAILERLPKEWHQDYLNYKKSH